MSNRKIEKDLKKLIKIFETQLAKKQKEAEVGLSKRKIFTNRLEITQGVLVNLSKMLEEKRDDKEILDFLAVLKEQLLKSEDEFSKAWKVFEVLIYYANSLTLVDLTIKIKEQTYPDTTDHGKFMRSKFKEIRDIIQKIKGKFPNSVAYGVIRW